MYLGRSESKNTRSVFVKSKLLMFHVHFSVMFYSHFCPLKKQLGRRSFHTDAAVTQAVWQWLRSQSPEIFCWLQHTCSDTELSLMPERSGGRRGNVGNVLVSVWENFVCNKVKRPLGRLSCRWEVILKFIQNVQIMKHELDSTVSEQLTRAGLYDRMI
jgi:hypothetical protein